MDETPEEIRIGVRERFTRVANQLERERKFPLGPESAKRLGYDPEEIDRLPPLATESFAGVGNPLGLGEPGPGQTVLDWGRSLLAVLADAGFVEGEVLGWTGYRTSAVTHGARVSARKPDG